MSYSYKTPRAGAGRRNGRPAYSAQRSNNRNKRRGQYIDPARFVAAATAHEAEVYVPTHTFSDFAFEKTIQYNLEDKGYKTPSPIQDQAIPAGLAGRDVIGMAGTGTGKTAAFALPIVNKLFKENKGAAIIIAPTRELAQQINDEVRSLSKGTGLRTAVLIGGSPMRPQIRDLQANPRIVIGTPGRIKDHIDRKNLRLQHFNALVLDEVDRMLDMGFVNDIREIITFIPTDRQSMFFSATMDSRVRALINDFTRDPVTVQIQTSAASENVHQDVIRFGTNEDKITKLHDLLIAGTTTKVIVFDETQRNVDRLSKELFDRGFKAEAIHGGKTQGHRRRALDKFKNDDVSILVATDVAARGIDVSDVSHVINYSIPDGYDDYIHRIGRAGRAGKIGYAFTFVSN